MNSPSKRSGNNTINLICAVIMLFCFVPATFAGEWVSVDSGTDKALKGVWGSSTSDVFVVGSGGTILHSNGSTWSAMKSGTTENLQGVYGSSSDNVFAVGENGLVLKYDGTNWTKTSSSTNQNLNAVWGDSGTDFFVAGEYGTILRCNQQSCTEMTGFTASFSYNGIWGTSNSDLFAVGANGSIMHYDGSAWSDMESGTDEILMSIWGNSTDDVFAAGMNGTILQYDGETWDIMPVVKKDFYAICGASNKYVLTAGQDGKILRYNGSAWSDMESGTIRFLQGLWVSPENDSYSVGSNGIILFNKNIPPTASFTVNNSSGYIETTFTVDASSSFDTEDDADSLEVRWDWENDGTWDTDFTTKKTGSHQYSDNATYTIMLEVKDTGTLTDTASNDIIVKKNSTPTAQFTVDPSRGTTLTTFTVDASSSFDSEGYNIDSLEFRWDWENDGTWDTDYSSAKTDSHKYQSNGTYLIRLEVIDAGGMTDSTTNQVNVGAESCIAAKLLGENDKRLDILRRFRDQVLANSLAGKQLTDFYYNYENNFGRLIENNSALALSAQKFLQTIIPVIDSFVDNHN